MPFIDSFSEQHFAVPIERRSQYRDDVNNGRQVMRRRRVVICGLARNTAGVLPATIARIERLGGNFQDYRAVIFENDSEDDTREILLDWQGTNKRVSILCEDLGDPIHRPIRCVHRAASMAHYRNRCRDFIASHFSHFDHVIVIDTDIPFGWSFDGIANTFGHLGWDFVGAYGILEKACGGKNELIHYDSWAFREKGSYDPSPTAVVNRMHWRRGTPMFEVYSCFGGLGIYRMSAMLACRYDGSDCEHVSFHRRMRSAGFDRLYLNPSQMTFYGTRPSKITRICHRISNHLVRRAA